jgi:cobalt/nickel transport protein
MRYIGFALILAAALVAAHSASAHFGMVIPSDSMILQEDNRTLTIQLSFSHPMEMGGMELVKPKAFNVLVDGEQQDLLDRLAPIKVLGQPAWQMDYALKRPGVYLFWMEPQPYWEPAEDCYIIHYTKTVVAAFGDDHGWDAEIGLKTEIVPLSRPFGLYAGNLFQGIVKMNGRPVPNSPVEIEFYNQGQKATLPNDYMVTQTVRADANGVFSYSVPAPGWWGFAALNPSDRKIDHEGQPKEVELGAVVWVKFHPWSAKP